MVQNVPNRGGEDLRQNLKLEREKRHFSRIFVASKIGVSSETIKKLENGDRNPGIATAKKIAIFYGRSLEYLFPDIFLIKVDTKSTGCSKTNSK